MRQLWSQLNRSLLAIIAEAFASRFSFGLISFALPLYAYQLGMSLSEIGLLIALKKTLSLFLKLPMARLADRFGRKRLLSLSIILRSLVALLLAFSVAPWQLFALRLLHGGSEAMRDPAASALVADHGGKKAIASVFAWYGTSKSAAGALGSAVAGLLLTLNGGDYREVFLLAFFLSVLPLWLVICQVEETVLAQTGAEPPARGQQEDIATERESGRKPAILPFIGLGLLLHGTTQMVHGLLPVLATEYAGLTEAAAGSIYLVTLIVTLIAGPLFGWLADNVSRRLVFLVRSLANVLSSLIFILVPSYLGVLAGKGVDDLGKAAFQPSWGALSAQLSQYDPRQRAWTMGKLNMGKDAGAILGPLLAGLLWSLWGVVVMLGVRTLLAVLTELYAIWLFRRQER